MLALGSLGLSAGGAPRGAGSPGAQPHGGEDEESPLARSMEMMKSNLKKLGGALKADRQADALAAVAEIERCVLESKLLEPANLPDIAAADRPAHVLAFRRELARLLQEVAALEIDLIDGKKDAVLARIQGSLKEMRDDAHEKFQRER